MVGEEANGRVKRRERFAKKREGGRVGKGYERRREAVMEEDRILRTDSSLDGHSPPSRLVLDGECEVT